MNSLCASRSSRRTSVRQAVDVPLHPVSAEGVADPQGRLEVHPVARAQPAEAGARQRLARQLDLRLDLRRSPPIQTVRQTPGHREARPRREQRCRAPAECPITQPHAALPRVGAGSAIRPAQVREQVP